MGKAFWVLEIIVRWDTTIKFAKQRTWTEKTEPARMPGDDLCSFARLGKEEGR